MYGNFKTAYKTITDETVWVARLFYHCVNPIWTVNTARVTKVRSPAEFLKHEVAMCKGKWAEEILQLLDGTIRDPKFCETLDLFMPDAQDHVHEAFDQVLCIYHYRVQSLKLHEDEPPRSLLKLVEGSHAEIAACAAEASLQLTILLATEDMERKHKLAKTTRSLLFL